MGGRASRGSGPRKQESEQLEDVLRVCRVLQLVVRVSQPIIRDGNRVGRVHGEVARKVAVILLIFTDGDLIFEFVTDHRIDRVTRTHERQAPPCTKQMSGAGASEVRWGTNKSKVCKGLISFVYGISKNTFTSMVMMGEEEEGTSVLVDPTYPSTCGVPASPHLDPMVTS
ncbi:hypothetical protein EI94DRAFT_12183 [Lactarius quietus]|nr:hypothetical protein EI94DRAFT_12183 [Lactarius quietus]